MTAMRRGENRWKRVEEVEDGMWYRLGVNRTVQMVM